MYTVKAFSGDVLKRSFVLDTYQQFQNVISELKQSGYKMTQSDNRSATFNKSGK